MVCHEEESLSFNFIDVFAVFILMDESKITNLVPGPSELSWHNC